MTEAISDLFRPSSSDTAIRPSMSRSSSFGSLISGVERYGEEWGSDATTLIDVIETFFDSRLDLINRRLKAQSAKLRTRAAELIPAGLKTPLRGATLLLDDDPSGAGGSGSEAGKRKRGDKYRKDVEREVERIKVKLAAKVSHLSTTWRSAQIVRTKEKISFLFGVLTLTFSCILYGSAPEWLPFAYTAQSAFYLPVRIYTYKKKSWHYFLFDLCYFVNILDLVWMWIFPQSTVLFLCCYCLTLGPLASAIITWRNSMVFHSLDKVTSLFIHLYPPLVLSVISHEYPGAAERYPGLKHVNEYSWYTMILLSAVPYILWQASYYKFISIDRKSKIESGQRENSFHYMLNDKRGPIGKALQGIKPDRREIWFIFGQFIYSLIFMLPPATIFIHSAVASKLFLIIIFSVSAWNGASFYVEVFGRKFERELEKLRKEMELASATGTSNAESMASQSAPESPYVDVPASPSYSVRTDGNHTDGDGLANSPLMLPGARQSAAELEVPELVLDRASAEMDHDHDDSFEAEDKKDI